MRRWLIVITGLGLLLRLYGISFGLPYLYHPDEAVAVHETLRMAGGGWRSSYSFHPHLFNYLLLFAYAMYYGIEKLLGHIHSVEEFKVLFITHPTGFYLLGRILSASFAIATIPLLYKTGERLYGKTVGLLSAFFLTFSFLHISNAHYLKLTMAETFFVLFTYFFMIEVIQKGRLRDTLCAGFSGGVSLSTNYNAGIIIPFVFLAQLLRSTQEGLPFHRRFFEKKMSVCLLATAAGFLLTSPLLLFNLESLSKTFWRMTGFFGYSSAASLTPPSEEINPLAYYLFSSLRYGLGIPLELLTLVGLLYVFFNVLKERRAEEICLISFTICYIFVFSRVKFAVHRYIIPVLPFLLLSAAAFLTSIVNILSEGRRRTVLLWSMAIFLVVLPARDALYHDWLISSTKDTRTQAKEWIEENVPAGTGIAVENYVRIPAFQPPILEEREESQQKLDAALRNSPSRGEYRRLSLRAGVEMKRYKIIDLIEEPHLVPAYENYYDFGRLKRQGVRFVILNHLYQRPFKYTGRLKEKRIHFEEDLKPHARLVKQFNPLREGRPWRFINHESAITPFERVLDFAFPGPRLEVYELKL